MDPAPEDRRLLAALRDACARLPEIHERIDGFGHTVFKVRRASFLIAGQGADGVGVSIRSDPAHQAELVRRGPYYRTPYIGRHGWVTIDRPLEHDWAEVARLIVDAYRRVAPKRLAERVPRS